MLSKRSKHSREPVRTHFDNCTEKLHVRRVVWSARKNVPLKTHRRVHVDDRSPNLLFRSELRINIYDSNRLVGRDSASQLI